MKNIFIIGAKGIGNYGGYETFVDELVTRKKSNKIKYHVACMNQNVETRLYNGAECFSVHVPNIGPAKAIYYDVTALKQVIKYIKRNNLTDGIVYVLACRIGPFFNYYVKKLHKLNFKIYINPDGHEWKRAKWNYFVKKYWKISERLMVKYSDLVICDSINIEKYIHNNYRKYKPNTTFIAYGADTTKSSLNNDSKELKQWYEKFNIRINEYYLIVGRFVPENNYETIIREFINSKTKKDLVIITNVEQNKFYQQLKEKTKFENDKRIKFVGTVYDKNLIKKIRENAYGYFHGHEVGGTNPSLLEALASTKLNLLLDVGFNKEVAEKGALYWNKKNGDLSKLIDRADNMQLSEIDKLSSLAKSRIDTAYSWEFIVKMYERTLES